MRNQRGDSDLGILFFILIMSAVYHTCDTNDRVKAMQSQLEKIEASVGQCATSCSKSSTSTFAPHTPDSNR